MAEPECRTTLFSKRTCSIVVHGADVLCARTVNRTAKPDCPPDQLFSIRLPSIWTKRAFFSSSRFFTTHAPRTPRDGPGDVVAADDDVARDQLIDGRRGSAEQDADPGRLDVVVLDDEGARPVPARDPLCLLANQPDTPDVAVADVRVGAVERDAALLPRRLVTSDHDAVEDQISRHECPIPLHRISQGDDIATTRAGEAKADETPVMGARGGPQSRGGVGRSHRREQRLVRQVDARRAVWQLRVRGRGANGDVGAARLHRQDEVAIERRTCLQLDDLAGLRLVQRGLEIPAGADDDRLAGRAARARCQHRRRRRHPKYFVPHSLPSVSGRPSSTPAVARRPGARQCIIRTRASRLLHATG